MKKAVMFALLVIQVSLLVVMVVTDATYNLLLLVPILLIAAVLVSQSQPATKDENDDR